MSEGTQKSDDRETGSWKGPRSTFSPLLPIMKESDQDPDVNIIEEASKVKAGEKSLLPPPVLSEDESPAWNDTDIKPASQPENLQLPTMSLQEKQHFDEHWQNVIATVGEFLGNLADGKESIERKYQLYKFFYDHFKALMDMNIDAERRERVSGVLADLEGGKQALQEIYRKTDSYQEWKDFIKEWESFLRDRYPALLVTVDQMSERKVWGDLHPWYQKALSTCEQYLNELQTWDNRVPQTQLIDDLSPELVRDNGASISIAVRSEIAQARQSLLDRQLSLQQKMLEPIEPLRFGPRYKKGRKFDWSTFRDQPAAEEQPAAPDQN
jgi:hypothetical protein